MSPNTDVIIMKSLHQATESGKPAPSITEMAVDAGVSVGAIHQRLQELINAGMVIAPPKPNMARSYRITDAGRSYLQANGYIPGPPLWR